MARFDVYRASDGTLVVDCQANFLNDISTRFIIPLVPPSETSPPNRRFNPIFTINGEPMILMTQFAGAILVSELRSKVASLADDDIRVINAIDVLTGTA